jgi:hypothetical protein
MRTIYTVGCYRCGEYHAYRDEDEANAKLDCLRADDPDDHDHDGLGVLLRDSEEIPLFEQL